MSTVEIPALSTKGLFKVCVIGKLEVDFSLAFQ